jgi:hypothetical protein
MALLSIVFKGQDEVGGVANAVAGELSGIGSAADDAGEKSDGFFGGMLKMAGGFLAANIIGGIATQVTSFASDSIAAARDTQQLMASTQQTIDTMGNAAGRSAQQVADLATSLSDAAGKSLFGDDQVQQSENLLLTFGEIKGAVFDSATALSVDLAAALGGAPKDQAMMLGKALNDPIHGMTALGKAGLTFSEEQKAAIAAMQESGDMAGAQAIIIAELNKQVGGQAEAQAKAAGGMVQFKARLGEVGETLASALLPVLDSLAGVLLDTVAPALETAATWLSANLPAAIATASAVIDQIIAVFTQAGDGGGQFADVLSFLGETWDSLSEIVGDAVRLIQATVVPAFQTIAQFLSDHSEQIKTILGAAWTIIKAVIDTALTLIKGVLKTALQLISGDWAGAWETIKLTLSKVWDNIKVIVGAALTILKTELSLAWDAIKNVASSAWDALATTVSSAWEGIKKAVTDKINEVEAAVKALPTALAAVGQAIVDAIWGGIESAWGTLVDKFNKKLEELRNQLPFSEPKDARSPLRGLSKAGQAIVEMVQSGIDGAGDLAVGAPLIGGASVSGGQIQGRLGASSSGAGGSTVRVVIDDRGSDWLKKFIDVQIESRLGQAGNASLSRQRAGG